MGFSKDSVKKGSKVKTLNLKYALLQMAFWSSAASAYAFLTQMLLEKGFGNTEIGIINAVKLFSTMIFQVIIGSFADQYAKTVPLKYIISALSLASFLLTLVFYSTSLSFIGTLVLFIGFGGTFTCISPFIDALSVTYENHGYEIHYAWCRATGSIAWAAASVIFGIFCDRFGANSLLLLQAGLIAVMALIALCMERADEQEKQQKKQIHYEQERAHTVGYLLRCYPKYVWFLAGSSIMFMGYNLGTTFLIQVMEQLGGTNAHYGMAEFVLAISEVPSAYIMVKCRKRISMDKMMLCCAVFMTLKNAFAAYAGNVEIIILSQSCEMLGFGLFYAGSVFMTGSMLPSCDAVKGVSLINAATVGIGEGAAAFFCGILKENLGLHGLMQTSVLVSAVSIVCMWIMCKMPVSVKADCNKWKGKRT